MENENPNASPVAWAELLRKAVQEPGATLSAYRAFHNYSMGNQMLAWWQCMARGLPIGPINTYKGWQTLGRNVRKGSKALQLCMPVSVRAGEDAVEAGETTIEHNAPGLRVFTRFIYRRNWFVLAQTDGAEQRELFAVPELTIDFSLDRALAALPDGTRAAGNAGGPSALIAYSDEDATLLDNSGLNGAYVVPVRTRPKQ